MNSPSDRMLEFLHFIRWTKNVDRTKTNVLVNPQDPENPFIAYADEHGIQYGWGDVDDHGIISVEFE
jgi:hypothetical protein